MGLFKGMKDTTTLRMTIAGANTAAYLPGSQYAVKVDPVDRTNLTFAPAS